MGAIADYYGIAPREPNTRARYRGSEVTQRSPIADLRDHSLPVVREAFESLSNSKTHCPTTIGSGESTGGQLHTIKFWTRSRLERILPG
jgi:hypothetical protein